MTNYPKPSWKVRRRIIHATLLFCAACVTWIMFSQDTRPVAEIIVMCSFSLGFATIGSYIFGAVWDDKNHMTIMKSKGGDSTGKTARSQKPYDVVPLPLTKPPDEMGD